LETDDNFDELAKERFEMLEGPLDDRKLIMFLKSAFDSKGQDLGPKKDEYMKKYDRDKDWKLSEYEFKVMLKDYLMERMSMQIE